MRGDLAAVRVKLELVLALLATCTDKSPCNSILAQASIMSQQLAAGLDFFGHARTWWV
jgi:hypothetical protein